jgi:hypothetical protein
MAAFRGQIVEERQLAASNVDAVGSGAKLLLPSSVFDRYVHTPEQA